jgi:hypothetical protein
MKVSDLLEIYPSKAAIARALKISPAALTKWGNEVPLLRQYELQAITAGRVQVDNNKRVA